MSFFIIFIHEWAHLTVWYKYGNKVEPHGKEWKDEYTTYLSQALLAGIFPGNISSALAEHIQKPVSSVCYDEDLFKILKKYHNPGIVFFIGSTGRRTFYVKPALDIHQRTQIAQTLQMP